MIEIKDFVGKNYGILYIEKSSYQIQEAINQALLSNQKRHLLTLQENTDTPMNEPGRLLSETVISAQKNGQFPQTGEKRSSALAVGASLSFARTQLRLNL